jgi:hypothetical protein
MAGSRVISAQKANTANAFSLPGLALSTANLYSAVQPGGSLRAQESNPVDTQVAYGGIRPITAGPTTRWSADASAASTSSVAGWRSTTRPTPRRRHRRQR